MRPMMQKIGKGIRRGAVRFLQFLYNLIYITGIQTLRILKRMETRVERFLAPLEDLFRRLYARFLRRRVRFFRFASFRVKKDLQGEARHIRKAHREDGLKSALSRMKDSQRHRAVLATVMQVVLPAGALLFLAGSIWFWNQQSYGLYVEYGSGDSAVVEDEGVFDDAAEMMKQRMAYDTAAETNVAPMASYRLGIVDTSLYEDAGVICDTLIESSGDIISDGAGLYINGELGGVVRSSTDLRYVLRNMLNTEQKAQEADSAEYLESLEIVNGLFPTDRIVSVQTLQSQLKNRLHIQVVREETYEEEIPYRTVTKKDSSQYTDYSKVTQEGKNGVRTCVDQVSYVGEEEVGREEVSRMVTKEAVDRVVVVGTKKRPTGKTPGEASGTFTWPSPVVRNISSYYGSRWGTTHQGLDFSNGNSYGQTIVAADGGTVSYVKLQNYGYGYHLVIDHGNGYQTMYAHASKILVSAGQKVAKGQPIAQIGNTGDSTGAHLHFEIIKNGAKVDPLPYLQG